MSMPATAALRRASVTAAARLMPRTAAVITATRPVRAPSARRDVPSAISLSSLQCHGRLSGQQYPANRPDPACWPKVMFPARNATRTRAPAPHGAACAGTACLAAGTPEMGWSLCRGQRRAPRGLAESWLCHAVSGSHGPRPPKTETDSEAPLCVRRRTWGGLTAPQRSSSEMGSTDCPQTRLASTDDKTSSSRTLTGRIRKDSMNQGTHPEELSAEVLDDVASVVGAEVTVLSRLPGGVTGSRPSPSRPVVPFGELPFLGLATGCGLRSPTRQSGSRGG
jgi:hypothetical protein